MAENRIAQALTKLFDSHRIIFWYDAKKEMRADFEFLSLPGIEKQELNNNEFGLKYKILREKPAQQFLIYHEGTQPTDVDNWLLDVQLANRIFSTDQTAIWCDDLGLGIEFIELLETHLEFFRAVVRRDKLQKALTSQDTRDQIKLKMLAVCTGSDMRFDAVLENLLEDLANGRDGRLKLIQRSYLEEFLWEQMNRFYGYHSEDPSIKDFAVELFKSCYAMATDGEIKLLSEALVFLKRWKDSRTHEDSFEKLSEECADVIAIEQDLQKREYRDLIEIDYFELIDRKIISSLVSNVIDRTVSSGDVSLWVRQRRLGHWYHIYRDLYQAIDYASRFFSTLGEANLGMNSLVDGIQKYSSIWYQLDQLYRKYTYHARKSGMANLLEKLSNQVENYYSNNFLLKLGNSFQEYVDGIENWDAAPIPMQRSFFKKWVKPFLDKDKKVCVIISDAMRYEIGQELMGSIAQEDRYGVSLDVAVSTLPSYTQLGMAALLPNSDLEIVGDKATTTVDGESSMGTANRDKILKAALDDKAAAIKYEDLMGLNREDSRNLFRSNNVVYVYHNRIDHTGDKMHSEGEAFDAAENAQQDIIKAVKKLTAANASNILITADHGFIYQNSPLDESDFSDNEAIGTEVLYRDRRFVLGRGLQANSSLKRFTSKQLGLEGDIEVQIPKSINRLRLKGSGSRFVHGGATLQEIVIPVLKVNKKRHSDIENVDVEIIPSGSSNITAGQLAVALYQKEPVTEKRHARTLRLGLYTLSGDLISDQHELNFDLTSDNPREREYKIRLLLGRGADAANGQEVVLKLEEKHSGTSHYKEYKSAKYMMRRSFTSDFDF